MLFRNKRMPLVFIVLVSSIIFAACSGTPVISQSANNTFTSQSQQSGSGHKLFVFLSGFTSNLSTADAAGNGGYGSDPDFFGNSRIQPFLQAKFPGSYFLTYSYSGFTSDGKPSPYTCPLATDSNIADLAVGLYSQISQFLRSHPKTPNTNVYVIGHSLGGVIAFSFLSQMIEGKGSLLNSLPNGGVLKGVFTLDAPIGGVSDNKLYVLASLIHTLTKCFNSSFIKQPIVKQLNDLFNSATLPDFRGATASVDATITLLNHKINETVAFDAMQHGITVSTFGNTNDVMWQPNLCTLSIAQDFSITQWLREVKAGRNRQGGAVYARSFTSGPLSCSAILNNSDPANHFAVLTDPNIQTAIWQVITGGAPDALTDMPVVPTPTPTTIPVPVPTPTQPPPPTPTNTPTPTATPTPTPTATPSPTPTPTATPIPTPSPTPPPTNMIAEFPLPSIASIPEGITTGPDGNLWFAERQGKIGRITPNGTITEFSPPTANSGPSGITAGPDGNLWFTETSTDQIGRITPNGTITEFPLPTRNSNWLFGITAGPDGNLWFTEFAGNKIGRITPNGTIAEFPLPTATSGPFAITTGPDGNLWFVEAYASQIGRITPDGTITEFPTLTPKSSPWGITSGPDGNLWFTENSGIGRITPNGTITEFPTPNTGSGPWGITSGPDGNLWFTEINGNNIGRITHDGTITEFPLPTASSSPWGITAGPDGNLWFTERQGNKIGRIAPH